MSAPTITAVSPIEGSPDGGNQVTLTGTNFVSGMTVEFGGKPATNVNVISPTEATCDAPSELWITSVSPVSGSDAGGDTLTITGRGFEAGASVTVGGSPATGVTVDSSTQITCTTPSGTAGDVDVEVSQGPDSPPDSVNLVDGFEFTAPLWTPANITTELWLKLSDAATVTDDGSGNIDQVDDKSGNSRHLAHSTGAKATLTTVNGLNALLLAGAGTLVTSTFNLPKPCTIYVVGSNTGGNGYRRILNIEGDFKHFIGPANGSGNVGIHTGDGSTWGTLAAATPATTWPSSAGVYVSRFAGNGATDLLTVVNGTELNAAPAGTWSGTASAVRIGGVSFSAIQRWIGTFCELVIVSGADSLADRQRMEGYLAHDWGFAGDLGASHPYKSAPP